jgi:hypothetical protein
MPQRLLAEGFGFQHAGIAGALAAELG